MLVPFAEALRQSTTPRGAQDGACPAARCSRLVFPMVVGRRTAPGHHTLRPRQTSPSARSTWARAAAEKLAVAGLFARRAARGRSSFFAGGWAWWRLLLALNTGPLTKGIRHIPILHSPNLNRVLVLASFALAMLAAYGCERLLRASAEGGGGC